MRSSTMVTALFLTGLACTGLVCAQGQPAQRLREDQPKQPAQNQTQPEQAKPEQPKPEQAKQDQSKQESAEPEPPTIRETVRIVMAPVTVTNRSDELVGGLTPADFRLMDNGTPQKITEDIAIHPISMVIAVEASAKVEKILPQIQKLGAALQQQVLGDDGEAAVIAFDHRIQELTDFTSDVDKLSKALKQLKAGSNTSALNDAAIKGINMLRARPQNRRRVLLLISESRDYGSELRPREVLTAAEFANVVVYSIDISPWIAAITQAPPAGRTTLDNRPPGAVHLPAGMVETPTTQSQMNMGNWVPLLNEIFLATKAIFVANPLEVYTTYTGGREFSFKNQRELDDAVSDLGAELHSQYLLTYMPNNTDEGGYHHIVVQVLKPDLKIRAREGYYLGGGKQP